ncbi:5-hydroxyisourate hydrolase [Bacteroides sp. CAG:661]|nr:5-hydroxyisourate hydrolase [Bacteroides sp. CAG:661]
MKKIIWILLVAWTCSATAIAQQANYQLSSHILDINRGQPASGVKISLSKLQDNHTWQMIDEKLTDENGRVKDFLEEGTTDHRGIYKLTYHISPYFESLHQSSFYPFIEVVFEIKDNKHYHVPITLSPYSYSTYRGN